MSRITRITRITLIKRPMLPTLGLPRTITVPIRHRFATRVLIAG
jgi:hypothetical protein